MKLAVIGIFMACVIACQPKKAEDHPAETKNTAEPDDESTSEEEIESNNDPVVKPGSLAVSLETPVEVFDSSQATLGSTMDTDVAATMAGTISATALMAGTAFTLADCDDKAKPLARTGDSNFDFTHPRYAVQEFYCKMNKDTFAADSFLGAITESRMLPCLLGSDLEYDGSEHEKTLTRDEFQNCLGSNLTQEKKDELTPDFATNALILVYKPRKFDDALVAGEWDVSIEVSLKMNGTVAFEEQMLLKDSNDTVAIGYLRGKTHATSGDGWMLSIDKVAGEVRFESRFQRIYFASTEDQYGANIHGRVISRGTMNEDNLFTSVTAVEAAFSTVDNSTQSGSRQPTDPVTAGTVWTVSGDTAHGVLSRAYQLKCPSAVCGDVNDVAQWEEQAGSGACNGAISTSTCDTPGIKFTSNDDTAFFMDKNNTRYQTVVDWFSGQGIPVFPSVAVGE